MFASKADHLLMHHDACVHIINAKSCPCVLKYALYSECVHSLCTSQVNGAIVTNVVDCASVSGLTLYAISTLLAMFYIAGLPRITRHFANLCLRGFATGGTALHSF